MIVKYKNRSYFLSAMFSYFNSTYKTFFSFRKETNASKKLFVKRSKESTYIQNTYECTKLHLNFFWLLSRASPIHY